MTGQSRGRSGKWLRVAIVVGLAVAVHALNGSSAQAAPAKASASSDIVLAGFTSEQLPAYFKISSDGKALLSSGIAIRMGCTSGAQPVWPDAFAHIPIAANGRLHVSFTPPTTTQSGVTTSATDTLTAHLNPAHSVLTGTWHLSVHVTLANGQSVSCDSGRVRFTATS
jgi:hypothetical protein